MLNTVCSSSARSNLLIKLIFNIKIFLSQKLCYGYYVFCYFIISTLKQLTVLPNSLLSFLSSPMLIMILSNSLTSKLWILQNTAPFQRPCCIPTLLTNTDSLVTKIWFYYQSFINWSIIEIKCLDNDRKQVFYWPFYLLLLLCAISSLINQPGIQHDIKVRRLINSPETLALPI